VQSKFFTKNLDRPDAENIVILITDAKNSDQSENMVKEAEELRKRGFKIITVGIRGADVNELKGVASQNSFAFYSPSFERAISAGFIESVWGVLNPVSNLAEVSKTVKPLIPAVSKRVICDRAKLDLVFLLDASTSVTEPNFELLKDFVKDFLLDADIDGGNVRVGVVIYSDADYVQFQLNTYAKKADVYNAIDDIPYRYGSTNTADALKTMRSVMFTAGNGDRSDVDNIAVVVTDGVSNINSRRTVPEAEQARAEGIHIYAIGIGLTDTRELDGIASKPVDENMFAVQDFTELRDLRHKVISALCSTLPPVRTEPTPPPTRPPITPKQRVSCAGVKLDLVFLLDASTSVTEPNFELLKDFVKDFLLDADIDEGKVRVSVVIYSDADYVQFQLNTYAKKADVYNAIDDIPYRYGSTNTADALKTMRSVMFTAGNGDRSDVDNIAVVVTDGVSNINSRRTVPEAEQARAEGIHIYAIGIGLTDTRELDGIASKPVDENRFAVQDFTELRDLRHKVFSALCSTLPPVKTEPTPPPTTPKQRVSCAGAKLDLVFVLDASTSVTEPNFELMKDFVKDFLLDADIDGGNVRVGVVIYSDADYVQFQLNTYAKKADVYNAIDDIPYRYGSTNTADALKTMRAVMFTAGNGDRSDVDNVAVVVTDGVSNINSRRTVPEAEQARAEGIHIYAIGIGLTDTRELDGIASKPVDENRFAVQDFTELRDLRHKVFSALCSTLPPVKTEPTPPPTTPKQRVSCAGAKLDLVFVLDASTSVTEPNFELMKDFVKDFLLDADIDGGNVRVGVVIYSDADYVQFQLNTYAKKADVYNAIDDIPYRYGSTNTADALKTMRAVMFTAGNGDRSDVDNVAVVVTDGVSNINSRRTVPEAEQARAEGIHIYAIGIGLTDTRELDGIASKPVDENRFAVQDFTELRDLRHKVFSALCSTLPPVKTEPTPPPTTPKQRVSCAGAKLDLVFVLDASTSVTEPNFELMKDFVKDFLLDADIDGGNVRVGVVIYSDADYVQFQLNTYAKKADVYNAIDDIPYRYGSTNTADALKTMRAVMFTAGNGDRSDVDNVAVVVTDGVSNINSRRTVPEAEQARAEGIHIYAIGIGLTDTRELDGIASKPVDENRFAVQDFTELRDLRHKVFSALCSTLPPVKTEPTPPPTTPKQRVSCAGAKLDLVFVLDASTSVTEPNFELMKDFVKDFLLDADIDGGNVRVGVVIYSDADYVQFQLNTYAKKADVYNAIDDIPYRYGSTNTADALKTMRAVMFTAGNGDRSDVDNVAVVVTDGVSNINSRRTVPEAEQARAEGIHIYAIGIGLTDTRELDGIASKPVDENRFAVQDFTELRDLRHKVFSALCSTLPPVKTEPTPPPTTPKQRVSCAGAKLDLVFVLDASTSVTEPNFELMKDFVKDFLLDADIDGGNVRVGVVIYSDADYVQFQLNTYAKKADVYNAIDDIPYRYGSTNTADALKTMRAVMFTAGNGDRSDVDNVAVVVTDGVSNINSRRTVPEAEQARAEGIHIYAIGIGLTDTRELDGIASKPVDENRFAVQDFTELRDLRHKVFSALCSTLPPVKTEPTPPPTTPKQRVSCAGTKLDLVFVLDASTSVTEPNFELMKDFVKDFLLDADIDRGNVRVGVVIYSDADYVQFQLNTYAKKADVYNAIDDIPYRYGSTNTADALKTMRSVMFTAGNGDRSDVDNIAVVVTDGVSNINSRRTVPEAEQARAEGIHIYAIGIGLTDTRELDGIASKPVDENRFAVQDFTELRDLRHKVFSALCSTLPPVKTEPTPPPTTPKQRVSCAGAKLDLVFVLDASTSVTEPNFELMKDFVKDFLLDADIDRGNVRVGVVIYSDADYVQFQLNTYAKKADVYNAIDDIPYRYGSTNTADALKTMRSVMFTAGNGDRSDVDNIAVVVTDGVSNINSRRTVPEAEQARAEGIHIYAIGIGLTDTRELDGIASKPVDENRFAVQDFTELRDLRHKVFSALCSTLPPVKTEPTPPPTTPKQRVSCAGAKLDLVFVLDASTSVTEPNFELMKDFVKDFLLDADIDRGNVRVGVVIYSDADYVQFQLNTYAKKADVYNAIDDIPYRYGSTNTADALKTMRSVMFTAGNGDRSDVDNIAVVVTDGVSNINSRRTVPEAEQARAEGIHIYAIGIGLTDTRELDGIASKPVDENRFAVQDFTELRDLRHKVFSALCSTLPPVKTEPTPPPTTPKQRVSCAGAKLDLVFVLDASTSVTEPNFKLMKDFVKDFLLDADIDGGNVRVGVVIYSNADYVQFQLNTYAKKADVYNAIDDIPYRYGSTNTADALKTMRSVMFTAGNGDRSDVDNVAVVVTDGVSNINSRRTVPEAEQARAEGIHIYAIGIGFTDTKELDGIASKPVDENRFAVQDFTELRDLRHKVFSALCSTSQPVRNEPTPPPTTPKQRVSCAGSKLDLVFVLDASTSVTEPNFKLMKDFVKDFLPDADIDGGNVRVGVVIYSNADYVQFQLNTYAKKADVYNAIDDIPYRYGSTNTADALKTMRSVMFTAGNGDRSDVDNVAVVVTDGVSNINSRRTVPEAEQARAEGIHIYAIGIGLTDTKELDGIASKPVDENRFAVQDFTELRDLRHKVFSALCG
ncbi:collagen alpha-3(VI) chain-like isoform X4, partial [Biomphalaria pfeifferi]